MLPKQEAGTFGPGCGELQSFKSRSEKREPWKTKTFLMKEHHSLSYYKTKVGWLSISFITGVGKLC